MRKNWKWKERSAIKIGARPPRGHSCNRLGNNDARRIRSTRQLHSVLDEGAILVGLPRTEVIVSRLRARVMHRLHLYDRCGDANLPPSTRAVRRWSYMVVSSSFLTDYARVPQLYMYSLYFHFKVCDGTSMEIGSQYLPMDWPVESGSR